MQWHFFKWKLVIGLRLIPVRCSIVRHFSLMFSSCIRYQWHAIVNVRHYMVAVVDRRSVMPFLAIVPSQSGEKKHRKNREKLVKTNASVGMEWNGREKQMANKTNNWIDEKRETCSFNLKLKVDTGFRCGKWM